MCHRKIGIDRHRTLKERQALHPARPQQRSSGTVGLQRFKRRQTSRNLTERAQDIFLSCRLRLLVGENVAGRAVPEPAAAHTEGATFLRCAAYDMRRLAIALQPLQVRSNLTGVLIVR
jgi:hypothetical protein